jgi:uncharacterized RDD family membrane protein YckC
MGPGNLDEGVYYRRQDYAGFWRRLLVSTVDAVVALAGLLGLLLIWNAIMPVSGVSLAFLIWLLVGYLYFVVCKRSRWRTLGYRCGRVRIVAIRGDSPSSWSMTFRLILALMGTYSNVLGLVDLLWITSDDHRQALRDKLARTYVVRASAQPTGRGPIVYNVYHVLGWTLLLQEVRRIEQGIAPTEGVETPPLREQAPTLR